MRGIILAGGLGTRLRPLTVSSSKQSLPVFNKPLIFYPLSTLMLAGIREICIISTPKHLSSFQELLGDGTKLGIHIEYFEQIEPNGIPESLLIARDFIEGFKCALILGDNIFHGSGLGRKLIEFANIQGATIFGYKVKNPEAYGVATIGESGDVTGLVEKPSTQESNIAIPGLYFLDENASRYAQEIEYGPRGEKEIVSLLAIYLRMGLLNLEMLPRGTAWFDSGTFGDLHDASTYVRLMEERTGEAVGDPAEVAQKMGWV
jgi:glucose-1-phosphate thymidylyltransferase